MSNISTSVLLTVRLPTSPPKRYRYGISDANEPSLNAETEDNYHRVLQLRMRAKHGVTANNMETTFHT
jgi:hypothetical protein